ncbi:VOC family protein [Corynebacterium sp. HS2168-gen11]|uniref:VOC family protein n=1 Tax=Corynebacterium sp. HS2168-gen11 TaxID=2974027 RepID=UPI00216ACF4F|nr:VOC family protein [Corynebacterium sp. HS2168-gen11]MCS4535799.1 VOC family protein [Corynebacterium sp. HS2168-gen11]
MKLLAIHYARDHAATIRFYQALGLELNQAIDPIWTEMEAQGATLAVHSYESANTPKAGLEVCMVAEKPLEDVQADLVAAGFDGGHIVAEDFGRSLRVIDPDGNELQINDH